MDIEKLKHSIIDSDVKFTASYLTAREIVLNRRNNFDITSMCWIILKPVLNKWEIHNPETLILLHLQ